MSLTRAGLVMAMAGFIGVQEDPPGSNLTSIGERYGWNGVPWCAETVSCACEEVGFPLHEAAVGNIEARSRDGWFGMTWADSPSMGAIVCFDWKGKGDWNDMHTGIVEEVLPDGRFHTIEGNFADRCDRWLRDLTFVRGFALLPFDDLRRGRDRFRLTEEQMADEKTTAALVAAVSETRDNVRQLIGMVEGLINAERSDPLVQAIFETRDNSRKSAAILRSEPSPDG